ncbi:MAG: Rrf2 family transcriptional regulator [Acidobacteria bacterium]|nr:Rrf2 family transcriptional regulator [Acidobacteriota bacterium]
MNQDTQLAISIHILCLLALSEGERTTSERIAGSVNTNPVVIRRTLGRLRRAGFVHSQNGIGGGWTLARPAKEITLRALMDVIRTSPLLAMRREAPNPDCLVGSQIRPVLTGYYEKAEAALLERLGESTVADVVRDIVRAARKGRRV